MSRPVEDTRRIADDGLADMNDRLALLRRAHRNYTEHGAVNAAAEMMEQIEALENDIGYEEEAYRMTFR
jgi:hypothetical protein